MTISKLPWYYNEKDHQIESSDFLVPPDPNCPGDVGQREAVISTFAAMSGNAQDDIELILRACNSHNDLVKAIKGMLENYIELKHITLAMARSDAPSWMPGLNENDDVHVIAVRAALGKAII